MNRQGMIHLYIGNGKGKTTAATGLAVRALGHDLSVLFAQFLKNTNTGEKNILEGFPDRLLFFRPFQRHGKFLWNMTENELSETKEDIFTGWGRIKTEILSGNYDIVVLDEILDCVQNDLIESKEVLEGLLKRPSKVEIICTGRDAPRSFYEVADYITRMHSERHPYNRGIGSRYGIEY